MDLEEVNQDNEDSDVVENINSDNSDQNSPSEDGEPNIEEISNQNISYSLKKSEKIKKKKLSDIIYNNNKLFNDNSISFYPKKK